AAERHDLLREAVGLPAGTPVVLYHGGFLPDRGLEQLADAMLSPKLATAHLCLLGFGPEQGRLEALAGEARFGGRVHVLPAVEPDDLLDWVASADVSAAVNQPTSLNQFMSSPNKVFESIAAGTPVVSSDTPERRAILLDDPDGPLGELCDPRDPREIAAAIGRILDLTGDERTSLRRRCLRAARERLNWEREGEVLLALYA